MIRQEKDLPLNLFIYLYQHCNEATKEEHTQSLSIKQEYPKISDLLKKNSFYFSA